MHRAWILFGIAAVACRDPDSKKAPDPAPTTATQKPTPKPPTTTPRPELPAPVAEGSATGTLTLQEGFAAEPVDIAWRDTTEHDLRKRLQPLASQIAAIECRSQQCRLALVGSEQDLARTVDELATEKSLRGVAEQMHLTAPEKQPDGTLKLQVFARFSRYEQPR